MRLTQLGSEALVLQQVFAALRAEVHGGLDMQDDVEGHTSADNQLVVPQKRCAVVAAVFIKVQVTVIQLEGCASEETRISLTLRFKSKYNSQMKTLGKQ